MKTVQILIHFDRLRVGKLKFIQLLSSNCPAIFPHIMDHIDIKTIPIGIPSEVRNSFEHQIGIVA